MKSFPKLFGAITLGVFVYVMFFGSVNLDHYNAAHPKGARELLAKYPEGATVDVFYDSKKPKNSVLLPGINHWSYLPYLVGLVFFAFGIAIYLDAG